jgi:hypothetical protein
VIAGEPDEVSKVSTGTPIGGMASCGLAGVEAGPCCSCEGPLSCGAPSEAPSAAGPGPGAARAGPGAWALGGW